jgi:aromatic ring hydroxylase
VLTGAEYLESLRDAREVWIDGERVADVILTHRFFAPSYSADDLLAAREAIAHWSRGIMQAADELVADCLADYDLEGWTPGRG